MEKRSDESQTRLNIAGLQEILTTPSAVSLLPIWLGYRDSGMKTNRSPDLVRQLWNTETHPLFKPFRYEGVSRNIESRFIKGNRAELDIQKEYDIGEFVKPTYVGYAIDVEDESQVEILIVECKSIYDTNSCLSLYRSGSSLIQIRCFINDYRQDMYNLELETGTIVGMNVDGADIQPKDFSAYYYNLEQIGELYSDVFSFKPVSENKDSN